MSKRALDICAMMIALALAGMAAAQTPGTSNPDQSPGTTNPDQSPGTTSPDRGSGTTDSRSTSPPASTTPLPSPGKPRVAAKFAAPFAPLAGSRENAVALATALRTGSTATLTYPSAVDGGRTTSTTVTITPPTKPMGWGNVSHSLALAQFALNQAGITNPTGAQLQAALLGDTITTADGKTVTFAGVLQQRADGMGWGRIAQSYGTTMGTVNRSIKTPATAVATTTSTTPPRTESTDPAPRTASTDPAPRTVSTDTAPRPASSVTAPRTASTVTAAGTASGQGHAATRGLTTAGGTAARAGQGTKGLTTAAGATSSANSSGIVSADGGAHAKGNVYGRGVVTASGSAAASSPGAGASSGASNGIVTGAGRAGGVVTADPRQGGGSSSGHGKGKSGG